MNRSEKLVRPFRDDIFAGFRTFVAVLLYIFFARMFLGERQRIPYTNKQKYASIIFFIFSPDSGHPVRCGYSTGDDRCQQPAVFLK